MSCTVENVGVLDQPTINMGRTDYVCDQLSQQFNSVDIINLPKYDCDDSKADSCSDTMSAADTVAHFKTILGQIAPVQRSIFHSDLVFSLSCDLR